jgi:single-stranded-DNA-specific exonuclease
MKKWVILNKDSRDVIKTLLQNRGLKTKIKINEFLNPTLPEKLSLKELDLDQKEIKKTILRIKQAKIKKEKVIVYGDYDADGICATAVLWEALYSLGLDTLPYIPGRFDEGYGINIRSVKKLQEKEPKLKLIITVDNGIVAAKEIAAINKLGINIIVLDHHTLGKIIPEAFSIIHTTQICAAAIVWILARELKADVKSSLDLVALATIADQMPLIGANRSFAKYGLEALRKTQRKGLLALFAEAAIKKEDIGTYEVGYLIAPRINAMGRIEQAIDSLRLLCTKDIKRAADLADLIGKTNTKRQKIVEEVVIHARQTLLASPKSKFIILADENYHEGVIGLAASRLVDEFHRPAIVISKGKDISKASARSIPGFNIIESIWKLEDLLTAGGGHPMAAGFSLETKSIEIFIKRFRDLNAKLLTPEILERKLKIDLELKFTDITEELVKIIETFEPTGMGNPTPVFVSYGVEIKTVRPVGRDGKHLKLTLTQDSHTFDSIAFGMGDSLPDLKLGKKIDVAYSLEENIWNGSSSLQLKIKDFNLF